ncbi:MAG: hypothetical protein WAO52_20610 [Prolixibacteraceae bacterium]
MNAKLPHFSSGNFKGLFVVISALSLFLGGLIYLFLRPSEFLFFRWIDALGFENWLKISRQSTHFLIPFFPDWIIYSLPDGLWAFAYALLISVIWSESKSRIKYLWMVSIPVLVLGFEFLQIGGMISGTFCIQDIAFGLAGIISGILIGSNLTKLKNHEKEKI